ncbi:hypothetical protein [Shewanella sp.]|uniref:hypothetical protein n=1 Tax=Shewanella sp. TaxID=50422 RepID=UPI001EC06454|nr:hypothetical protein [Shewanella sp.]NRB24872.1 hypothetical protein [Shewanella sp.]
MKLFCILFIFLIPSSLKAAENDVSIGIGVGLLHSGLGANVAYVSDIDMSYFSAGCDSYSSVAGATCGVGVGYIRTGIFDENGKHGLGAHAGIVGTKSKIINDTKENSAIYGLGISYVYFFNGIKQPGFNLGLGSTLTLDGNSDLNAAFQIGYQF